MRNLTFEQCNDKKFVWINSQLSTYPRGTRVLQYHKSLYFSLVSYLDMFEVQQLIDFLTSHNLEKYIYIRHNDSDNLHFHILLKFSQAYTCRHILECVNICALQFHNDCFRTINTMCEYFDDRSNIVSYIFHNTDTAVVEGKKKYNWDECYTNDIDYWQNFTAMGYTNRIDNMWIDFDKGLSMYELSVKYGRDFVLNYKSYYDFYERFVRGRLSDIIEYDPQPNDCEVVEYNSDTNKYL